MAYSPYGIPGYSVNTYSPGTAGTNINGVPQVSSIDEVRAATVPYGSVTMFLNSNENILYAKNSQGLIKAYKYEEIPLPSNEPQAFVTREEFNKMNDMLRRIDERLASSDATSATQQPQPTVDHAADAGVPGNTGASQATVLSAS